MKCKKAVLFAAVLLCMGLFLIGAYSQELKITAVTKAKAYDITGKTNVYCFTPLEAGESYRAVIRFMAVKNKSDRLFAFFGSGQYVYMGCSELKAEYEFTAFDPFLRIRLTMHAAQTDLKLEDGTPFDVTRYSLKPVLSVEKNE